MGTKLMPHLSRYFKQRLQKRCQKVVHIRGKRWWSQCNKMLTIRWQLLWVKCLHRKNFQLKRTELNTQRLYKHQTQELYNTSLPFAKAREQTACIQSHAPDNLVLDQDWNNLILSLILCKQFGRHFQFQPIYILVLHVRSCITQISSKT